MNAMPVASVAAGISSAASVDQVTAAQRAAQQILAMTKNQTNLPPKCELIWQ